jgi:hypothetical protein
MKMLRTTRLRLTLLLVAMSHAVCSAQEPQLPEDVSRMKQAYEQGKERLIQPIRDRYLADLKRLLDSATREGKLADALAIKTEMNATSADADTIAEFERKLTGIKWNWNNEWDVTFKPDGTTGGTMAWESIKPYTINYRFPNGSHGTIVFERDLGHGTITDTTPEGKQAVKTLYRRKE